MKKINNQQPVRLMLQSHIGLFLDGVILAGDQQSEIDDITKIFNPKDIISLNWDVPHNQHKLVLVYDNFQIRIASQRIDIITSTINKIGSQLDIILSYLKSKDNGIIRVGFVKNFFVSMTKDEISTMFGLKDPYKGSFKELLIKNNAIINIAGIPSNNIELLQYGTMKASNKEKKLSLDWDGLKIMRDINSDENKQIKFDKKTIESYIIGSIKKLNYIPSLDITIDTNGN